MLGDKSTSEFGDKSISEIIQYLCFISIQGVSILEEKFKPTNDEGKFEIFMFNLSICFLYASERDYLDFTKSETHNNTMASLIYFSKKNGLNLSNDELELVFKERLAWAKKTLAGIQNSDWPKTKHYQPVYMFTVMYFDQLAEKPDLSWNDHNSYSTSNLHLYAEKSKELSKFSMSLVNQINWLFKKLGL